MDTDLDNEKRFEIITKLNYLHGDELTMIFLLTDKMLKGSKKYGQWQAKSDHRNTKQETLEELLDAVNYLAMGLVKEKSL